MPQNTRNASATNTATMDPAARINTGLTEKQRQGVAEILTSLLADEYVLYTKIRNYHWNVTGPQFLVLHEFFEEQYKQLNKVVDDMAERIRALDCPAIGTLAEFCEHSRLQEQPRQYPPARDMVVNLMTDHETIVRHMRDDLETCEEAHHDKGTADFLGQLMIEHEKMVWMLRALLQGDAV